MNNTKAFIIAESTTTSKHEIIGFNENTNSMTVKANLQDADTSNRNGRVYEYEALKEGLYSDYINERVKTKSWYGECGHPMSTEIKRQLHTDQTRISHIIKERWFDDKVVKGLIETANTRSGRDMMGLIKQESEVAFSMRGLGSVTEKRGDLLHIKSPLKIYTYDWVIHPSHEIAYMEKVLSESTMSNLVPDRTADLKVLSEGTLMEIQESSQMIEFIKDESKNVKDIIKQFELEMGDSVITLDEDARFLNIGGEKETFKVSVEDYVRKQLDNDLIDIIK